MMNLYKRIWPACLLLLLLLQSFTSAASAASLAPAAAPVRPITVNINGAFIATDSSPFIESGRIKISVRTLASLGLTYSWDTATRTATITNPAKDTFRLIQGQLTAYKNGQPVQLDSEAGNYNGRMMVPARFVSEAFGYSVYYERTRSILFITSKDYVPDTAALLSSDLAAARLAAISLPIQYNFTPVPAAESGQSRNYTYRFAANDATRYVYENALVSTVVEIKDGAAHAVWQYGTNGIPGYDLYTTLGGQQPGYMAEMSHDHFRYFGGGYRASYQTAADGSYQSFPYFTRNYGEIIQPIPE
ncbi:copper amine oxidase N-terminal domain-containing protein [Paenibacillus sp. FSL R10-2771]|uniref:copper amine oxidase N-terminal domain-containing protein n=1 Tax=Paenibacillus sp. FSL R10-2771 TaxID=2954693 RepID=UPI0030F996B8